MSLRLCLEFYFDSCLFYGVFIVFYLQSFHPSSHDFGGNGVSEDVSDKSEYEYNETEVSTVNSVIT